MPFHAVVLFVSLNDICISYNGFAVNFYLIFYIAVSHCLKTIWYKNINQFSKHILVHLRNACENITILHLWSKNNNDAV